MKYLLDTHIWLWIHREPERLSPDLGKLLRNPANELWLSPISVWEALLLHRKGRLNLHSDPHLWVRMMSAQLREARFTHEVAVVSMEMELLHADPADRFLAALCRGQTPVRVLLPVHVVLKWAASAKRTLLLFFRHTG